MNAIGCVNSILTYRWSLSQPQLAELVSEIGLAISFTLYDLAHVIQTSLLLLLLLLLLMLYNVYEIAQGSSYAQERMVKLKLKVSTRHCDANQVR